MTKEIFGGCSPSPAASLSEFLWGRAPVVYMSSSSVATTAFYAGLRAYDAWLAYPGNERLDIHAVSNLVLYHRDTPAMFLCKDVVE